MRVIKGLQPSTSYTSRSIVFSYVALKVHLAILLVLKEQHRVSIYNPGLVCGDSILGFLGAE
jgi:hypothetical protein